MILILESINGPCVWPKRNGKKTNVFTDKRSNKNRGRRYIFRLGEKCQNDELLIL